MVMKKGELTSQQLITIILLIVSFVIILAFFFMLNLGGKIDEQTCRNSVMLRGALPLGGNTLVDLKCKTKEVCFSMGGKCDVKTKDFQDIRVKDKGEILKEISYLMASCWSMMGEGKVNYARDEYCAICYKIYFDDKVKEDIRLKNGIPYFELYNIMTVKMSGKDISYLYYLYQMSNVQAVKNKVISDNSLDIDIEKIDPAKEYAIVTRVGKEEHMPPVLVGFSANELKNTAKCSGYATQT